MKRLELVENIRKKGSFLCVGLDPEMSKLPKHIAEMENPLYVFCKAIVDATAQYCVAYKPNLAFFEAYGADGVRQLEMTVKYIRENYPDQFIIADAKRGDIGNTARMYADSLFNVLGADAATVSPYMGEDSVRPFLEYEGKWTILLALTSNKGSNNFQMLQDKNGHCIYERVIKRSLRWGNPVNMMYVVGATKAEYIKSVRDIAPRSFLLVPGVGAQGGSLEDVAREGLNDECSLLVNSSRGIIYASQGEDFAEAAGEAARTLAAQMHDLLRQHGII